MIGGPSERSAGVRLVRALGAAGLAGLAVVALGIATEPRQAYFSYLTAYASLLAVALGALALLMVGHLTGARWIAPVRPLVESAAATLPLFALLFLPLLPGLDELYPWARPLEGLEPEVERRVVARGVWQTVPFFVLRAVLYLGTWSALAVLLRRGRRAQALSAAGLPLLALTLTFAAFDWLMALDAEWFSTMYGVYWFAGGFTGALALTATGGLLAGRRGWAGGSIGGTSTDALGKLLLTFVTFWAYIGFSQLLIYWLGNIPARIGWYLPRLEGSWGILAAAVAVGHFGLPFLVLLPSRLRRDPAVLAAVGAWLLVLHHLDVYWLVMPELHADAPRVHWLDAAALAGVAGAVGAYGTWTLRGRRSAAETSRRTRQPGGAA